MRNYIKDAANLDEVELSGWAEDIRRIKNIVFIILRDVTGKIQVTVKSDNIKNFDDVYKINRESVLKIHGSVDHQSRSKSGIEVIADSVEVLNNAEAPLPLGVIDKVQADLDTRLNNRYIDLRKDQNLIIFKTQSLLLWGIREYLNKSGFIEVHTPKIVAAATEGGADLFPVKYFEKDAYLNQSPQLYKEILMAAGFEKVFEVGPAFRAEKENTLRHLNEFTSIDIEVSFADHNDVMEILENTVKNAINTLKNNLGDELSSHGFNIDSINGKIPRIKYKDAIDYLNSSGFNMSFGDDFSPEASRALGERYKSFYFITEWPASLRPFYTMKNDDETTKSFDLQLRELEICSGAQRIHNYNELLNNIKNKGLNPDSFTFYLNAFRYGMPPHAGWAIGLERLTMNLLGIKNVRETTLFPRDRTRLLP